MGMLRRHARWGVLLALLLLCGCSSAKVPLIAPVANTATPTSLPHQTTVTACPTVSPALDSRISATGFVLSYYNAINRRDFIRAYGYLFPLTPTTTPTPSATPFPTVSQWEAGYDHTTCVLVTYTGAEATVTSSSAGYKGIGNGMVVPISFTAVGDDGSIQDFSGTYAVKYDPSVGIQQSGYLDLDFAHVIPVG
jgi:hypothetical protein